MSTSLCRKQPVCLRGSSIAFAALTSFVTLLFWSRSVRHRTPPPQNRTCPIQAYGSPRTRSSCYALFQPTPVSTLLGSCPRSSSLPGSVTRQPLPSIRFHGLLRYYELVGLPASHLVTSHLSCLFPYCQLPGRTRRISSVLPRHF